MCPRSHGIKRRSSDWNPRQRLQILLQAQGALVRLFSREMVRGRISTERREGAEDGRVTSSLIHMEFILCVRYGSNFMFFQKVD